MPASFAMRLLKWYEKHGRHDLPWQKNPTAYRVWISEIMLQQTQVATAIPYYQRFMASFPNLKKVAMATDNAILSHWSGLGYYARARNLHQTAKIIIDKYQGHFPQTIDALSALPGIGVSTAGAILSFAFQQRAVILDGNVKRVLTRYFAIDQPINQVKTMNHLWIVADKNTPQQNAHHYNQAIMDLGATLCTRTKPRCFECPLTTTCQANLKNEQTLYPIKTAKKARPVKSTEMLIIYKNKMEVLLCKRPSTGIWGGLWSFPEKNDFKFSLKKWRALEKITHQFTHFTLHISPVCYRLKKNTRALALADMIWYNLSHELPGGIPAPVAQILSVLKSEPHK